MWNGVPIPFGCVMLVGWDVAPSLQTIVIFASGKSLNGAIGFASTNVATSPLNGTPSTTDVTGVAVAVTGASATIRSSLKLEMAPPASLMTLDGRDGAFFAVGMAAKTWNGVPIPLAADLVGWDVTPP